MSRNPFGRVGVWVSRRTEPAHLDETVSAASAQGYSTVWIAGGLQPGIFEVLRRALDLAGDLPVGTSVLNLWTETPEHCAAEFAAIERSHPGRLFLGLGVSHAPAIDGSGLGTYEKPLAKTRGYLEAMAAAPVPVPRERLLLGALGPKMLQLAADRTLGSVPYLVTTGHTAKARAALGAHRVLAPELTVAVDEDADRARTGARAHLATYLGLPNYTNNFARSGFGAEHLEDGGSDELLEAVYGLGGPDRIAVRIQQHLDAGADHVALQIAPLPGQTIPEAFALLAPAVAQLAPATP